MQCIYGWREAQWCANLILFIRLKITKVDKKDCLSVQSRSGPWLFNLVDKINTFWCSMIDVDENSINCSRRKIHKFQQQFAISLSFYSPQISIFSPNTGKCRTTKTLHSDTVYVVKVLCVWKVVPGKKVVINWRIGEKIFEFTSLCVSQTAIKR